MTTLAAIIVGIDGWEEYTLPLVESIRHNEPLCEMVIVDNESKERYPQYLQMGPPLGVGFCYTSRTERLCYSAAINHGKAWISDAADWIIVLSNDVLCTGPFVHMLEAQGDVVAGPQLWHEHGLAWIVGWCVCIPRKVWDAVGGWDENYIMSSWEDVDFSVSANEKGYPLCPMPGLPFVHLDQKQRFGLPGYGGSEEANRAYFMRKHGEHAY